MTPRTGRPLDIRLRVRGWLRVQTPLHVGGIATDPAEALPVALDGLGRVYVPGTSLAGPMRTWMRGTDARRDALSDLWGYVPQDEAANAAGTDAAIMGGRASRIVLRDAIIATSTATDADGLPADPINPAELPTRHGVGIDRVTGTAAPEVLYARTVVPPGSYVRLEFDIESTRDDHGRDRARLGALLAALKAGQVPLGAATRRGLGVVSLLDTPLTVHEHHLTEPSGLLGLLRDQTGPIVVTELDGVEADLPPRPDRLSIRIDWRPTAPVMVRAATQDAYVGTIPLTTRLGPDAVALVLTGGSIKGTLRSHAEFIERTVHVREVPVGPAEPGSAREHSARFLDQLDQLPAVKALFGAARTSSDADATGADAGEPGGGFPWGAGALTAAECLSRTEIPTETWRTLTLGPASAETDGGQKTVGRRGNGLPAPTRERLAGHGMDQADHVAIDRWTGGAADGRLYSVLEPHAVDWQPIHLTVDVTRLGEFCDTALALLLMVLRDLKHGRIPLGGMVTRGFGDIEVDQINLTGADWTDDTELDDVLTAAGTEPVRTRLERAWQSYLEKKP